MFVVGIKLYDNTIYRVGDTSAEGGVEVVITTIVDNQKKAEVELYLIKSEYNKSYDFIGKITINNILSAKAGEPKIKLIITSDTENTLDISVYSGSEYYGNMSLVYKEWHPDFTTGRKENAKKEKKVLLKDYELGFKRTLDKTSYKHKVNRITSNNKSDEDKLENNRNRVARFVFIFSLSVIIIGLLVFVLINQLRIGKNTLISKPENTELDKRALFQPVNTKAPIKPVLTGISESGKESIKNADTLLDITQINDNIRQIGYIYFFPNSPEILKDSIMTLNKLASYISGYKGKIKINIQGHTAEFGTESERFTLSVERAKVVRSEIVRLGSIGYNLCTVAGFGSERPVALDIKKVNLNRRVEIVALLK